ncbi:hypothetical protein BGW37DRAFT_264050 [Umbelopsis sp. PMI_123]|nr:hypothetical protein BGW37DRAFT_264050 [Umbelopsis sp. PMI_123]
MTVEGKLNSLLFRIKEWLSFFFCIFDRVVADNVKTCTWSHARNQSQRHSGKFYHKNFTAIEKFGLCQAVNQVCLLYSLSMYKFLLEREREGNYIFSYGDRKTKRFVPGLYADPSTVATLDLHKELHGHLGCVNSL